MSILVYILSIQEKFDEVLLVNRKVLTPAKEVVGTEHGRTLNIMQFYGESLSGL